MKKSIISIALAGLMLAPAVALTSCGDQFQEEYPWIKNEGAEGSISEESQGRYDMDALELELRGAIPFMVNYSHEPTGSWAPHKYQYYRANTIDNYCGYWTTTKANFAFGPALPTLYTDDNGYLGGLLDTQIYQYSKDALLYAASMTDTITGESVARPEWRALALIIQGYFTHEVVDAYGVAPFTDWRNTKRDNHLTYEGGAAVYKQILTDLDEAIVILKDRQPSAADLQRVEGPDANKTMTDWQWQKWVKLANSLKMRMAMNMVDYQDEDPTYGPDAKPFSTREIIEEVMTDHIGPIMDTDDRDIAYVSNGTWTCCLYFMGQSWNDIRLNASMENILKHFRNPLLYIWFDKNAYDIKNASGVIAKTRDVYGVRAGLMMEDTGAPDKGGYGPFAILSTNMQYMDQAFFKRAETMFILAEAALRGYNVGGSAEDFYKRGIRVCMRQYGVSDAEIEAYLNQTNLPAVNYIDYYQRANDIEGRVTCDVKWNDADSKELKLEKIITQKWIANFPMGAEAWTTYRRTGYPRLFPVRFNNMQGVDTELQIRRMTFTETGNNGPEIQGITELLGGSQTAGTQVFWDINSRSWSKDENGLIIPDNHLN